MDINRISGVVFFVAGVVFLANILLCNITAKSIDDAYLHMKADFPICCDREILFMGKEKEGELNIKGVYLPFSWKANGHEIDIQKGVYFVSQQREVPFDVLSTPQREMYTQAIYYLEQGDAEKAIVPLMGLESTL